MTLSSEVFTGLSHDPEEKRKQLIDHLNSQEKFVFSGADHSDREAVYKISRQHFDVVILGAGPAGIYAAVELSKRNIKTCLLERGLFLETQKTFALPDTIVERYELHPAVCTKHKDTMFKDYFGLEYASQLDYCIMDQTKTLFLLAQSINNKSCVIVDNCEVTAYARKNGNSTITAKAIFNGYELIRYNEASEKAPRSTSLLNVNPFFYRKHDPYVMVNLLNELDSKEKLADNPKFNGHILIDAGGFNSNIGKSFHRQKSSNVWKCLVYEFEDLSKPQDEIIWDLAIPTQTSANFWVDVIDEHSAGAGAMVLTRTSPNDPAGHPSKREMEGYMSKWLNIRKLSGRLVRERYGFIPMTDFAEPAAYDNVVFIGAGATRQIPNTGFGFFPALEEATLLAPVIQEALEKKRYTQNMLRKYDIAWLKKKELSMALDIVLQDFHYAYLRDEYFHEFTECCTEISPLTVKRRILDLLTMKDIRILTGIFLKNSFLLQRRRIKREMYPKILKDLGRLFYCFFSRKLLFYTPEGNPMFKKEPPKQNFFLAFFRRVNIFLRRTVPEWFFTQLARVLFFRFIHAIMKIFV